MLLEDPAKIEKVKAVLRVAISPQSFKVPNKYGLDITLTPMPGLPQAYLDQALKRGDQTAEIMLRASDPTTPYFKVNPDGTVSGEPEYLNVDFEDITEEEARCRGLN